MSEKKWYVYLLCNPDTEEPFYVGKGTGDRMYVHESLFQSDSNKKKKQVIQAIQASGKEVLKKKIAEFENEEDAYVYEWGTINTYHCQVTNVQSGKHNGLSHSKKVARRDRSQSKQFLLAGELQASHNLLTIDELATKMKLSRWKIRDLYQHDGLPVVDLNGVYRFNWAAVKVWIKTKITVN